MSVRLVLDGRCVGLQLLHFTHGQLSGLTTPTLTQVVEQIGQLLRTELASEARHRLHVLEAGELLLADPILATIKVTLQKLSERETPAPETAPAPARARKPAQRKRNKS